MIDTRPCFGGAVFVFACSFLRVRCTVFVFACLLYSVHLTVCRIGATSATRVPHESQRTVRGWFDGLSAGIDKNSRMQSLQKARAFRLRTGCAECLADQRAQ